MSLIREFTFEKLKLKQHDTKAFIGKNKIIATVFPRKTGTLLYEKKKVWELTNSFRLTYANKSITFMVSVEIPDLGFRSGKAFSSSNEPNLPDGYTWEETAVFVIYAWKSLPTAGATGEDNDCLWECLCEARVPMNEIPFIWRSASKLKSQLKLSRKSAICYTFIPQIEEGLKINIHCIGDYDYTSPNKYLRTITVKLNNGHYTLVCDTDKELLKFSSHKIQSLILYFSDGEVSICYDGVNITERPTEEVEAEKRSYYKDYTFVKTDLRLNNEKKTSDDLIEEYNYYTAKVQSLYDATNGSIDMKRYGYSVNQTAKVLMYQHFKTLPKPDPITQTEAVWLMNTFKGGLMYGEDVELQNGMEYDINSAYPFFMIQPNVDFPMKEGVFRKIDTLPEILSYGIYRVKIQPSEDKHINKLFRFNQLNYYSHYDMKMAKKLGFQITLIQDEEANCLLYQQGRLKGCSMFKNVMEYLFDLKQQKIPFAKEIINVIWGMLCEKRKCYRITRPDGDKEIHIDDAVIVGIIPTSTGHRIKYMKNDRPVFVHNYARLGVFLVSRVRLSLGETMYPHRENIYRFHTDGFVSKVKIPEISVGANIGQYKIAHQGKCIIKNCMRVMWE